MLFLGGFTLDCFLRLILNVGFEPFHLVLILVEVKVDFTLADVKLDLLIPAGVDLPEYGLLNFRLLPALCLLLLLSART